MSEIELKARELLAAELVKRRRPTMAECVLDGQEDDSAAIQALIAALAPQWQTIESAPKAKTPMIVVIGVWGSYVTDSYGVFWDGTGWARWPHKAPPTHWVPLPAAPEAP